MGGNQIICSFTSLISVLLHLLNIKTIYFVDRIYQNMIFQRNMSCTQSNHKNLLVIDFLDPFWHFYHIPTQLVYIYTKIGLKGYFWLISTHFPITAYLIMVTKFLTSREDFFPSDKEKVCHCSVKFFLC